jgi:hypothetical protein
VAFRKLRHPTWSRGGPVSANVYHPQRRKWNRKFPAFVSVSEAPMFAKLRFTIMPIALVCASMTACYRVYPPTRPSGVPAAALWAGGLDGGGWVTCSSDSVEYNVCTIWDEQGRTRGPARYTLKDARAATVAELKYTYLTGEAIGLEGRLELRRVSPPMSR